MTDRASSEDERVAARRSPAESEPPRLSPLSVLPVFLPVRGRLALVAGGSAGAAWKAELLAAAGADVVVLSNAPGEEMVALAARGAADGSIRLARRGWQASDLSGEARPTLALLDADDDGEAAAFAAAARAAGVPVNVIDRPAFCDFQFGAIVNRAPLVVGISTAGAAPILAQAVRRRIETLLPSAVAGWAGALARLRSEIAALLPDRPGRRRFFERAAEMALRDPAPSPDEAEARLRAEAARAAKAAPAGRSGFVSLVGAGPGDAEMLTLKAVRALQAADVILFDDLVSDDVLELARREAKRLMVGKRGGRPSCRQEDISALMVKLARAGKRVVRLKSGDPLVFGRAGEEMAALRDAGIAFEVVPGITSAQALGSMLGVSLTHRDQAKSLRFVTGHARDGRLPAGLDWGGLADPQTTLVVYMGGRTAGELAERLIAAGAPEKRPVVVATSLSRPEAQVWRGTLADLAADAAPTRTGQPTLIAIGNVFAAAAEATQADGATALDNHARSA